MQQAFSGDALRINASDWNRVRQIANSPQLGIARTGGFSSQETYCAKTDAFGIPARSGAIVGSGTVTVYELSDSDELLATDIEIECKNISGTAVAADTYIVISKEKKTGKFVVVVESCEPPAS